MNQPDNLHEITKLNLVRLQAYLIVLQQDSGLGKRFFSFFPAWNPNQIHDSDRENEVLHELCDRLYFQYNEQSESEMSVSDIVESVWQNQPVFTDGAIEIADLHKLNNFKVHDKSKRLPREDSVLDYEEDVLIGSHPKWIEVLQYSKRVAESNFSVLISGETGVGKELIARRLHHLSRRSNNNCVILNCAAFSEGLIESELFGYEANSFTSADPKGKSGWISSADRGTLVLDEVADLSARAQAIILRAIESGELQKVGGRISKVDFRLI